MRCRAKQCLLYQLECQGESGHKGHHWAYAPDGALIQWRNRRYPVKDFGMSSTPPGHSSYIHPEKKAKEHYRYLQYQREVKRRKKPVPGKQKGR